MNPETVLFALLRAAVCGEEISEPIKEACTPDVLEQVYILAQKHDLAHLPGHVLGNLGLPDTEPLKKLKKASFIAVYRYEQLNYEFERICKTLEQAQIPFVPLKGSVIRQYYPEPWMRTSCDIDILVHEKDLEHVTDALIRRLNYRKSGFTPHDVSLFSPNGVHLELHYDTIEETEIKSARSVLSKIWEDAFLVENCQYRSAVLDEMLYFYHVAHMAKHVLNGGCGIRTFLDLWILNQKLHLNPIKQEDLLEQGGLLKFATTAQKLSMAWFSNIPMDTEVEKFAGYILSAGVYGSLENRVKVGRRDQENKLRYALSRIFLPHDSLKQLYPVLKKYRILAPIFQLVRWFQIIFTRRIKKAVQELHVNATSTSQQLMYVKELLDYIGLS